MYEVEIYEIIGNVAEYVRDINLDSAPEIGTVIDDELKIVSFLEPEEDGSDYRAVVEWI